MRTVLVQTDRPYAVHIEAGILDRVGEFVRQSVGGQTAVLVSDDAVAALYGDRVEESLRAAGYETLRFVFPHGEASKNAETYLSLLNFLAEHRVTRSDAVVALGGGVVGDLAGFAAATFLRGIAYVQIPTTLLAMVDSSVGGKTAIDLEAGKNLAGAFYQPWVVLCDPETLSTLPAATFADGCAEVIKYGVILDEALFSWLKEPIRPQIDQVIERCVQLKRNVVVQDERDHGVRQLLNFGHTVGHAVEANSHFAVSHGQAVDIGMCIAARAAAAKGLCSQACAAEVEEMVARYDLPRRTDFSAGQLARAALSDKKRSGAVIHLILPENIGHCVIREVPVAELEDFIAAGLAEDGVCR